MVYVLGELASACETARSLRIAAVLLLALLLVIFRKKRGFWLISALFFMLCGAFRYQQVRLEINRNQQTIAEFRGLDCRISGTVRSAYASGGKMKLEVEDAVLSSAYGSLQSLPDSASQTMRARYNRRAGMIRIILSGTCPVLPGENIDAFGTMVEPEYPGNDGSFNSELYCRGLGLSGTMLADSVRVSGGSPRPFYEAMQKLRTEAGHIFDENASEENAGLYRAMLLGDRGCLDEEIKDLYAAAGISHILAISGLHLSIIGDGLYALLRFLPLSIPTCGLISAFVILSYGVMTASGTSAFRAVLMLLLKFTARSVGRSYDLLSSLGIAAVLLLLEKPYLLFSSGFQLSFLAVLSLGIVSELPKCRIPALQGFFASVWLQLFTIPLILQYYFTMPVYALILNLLILPLASYLIGAGLLTLLLYPISKAGAAIFCSGGELILGFYREVCGLSLRLPVSKITPGQAGICRMLLYYLLILLAVVLMMERKKLEQGRESVFWHLRHAGSSGFMRNCTLITAGIVASAFLILFYRPAVPLEVTAMDVGQGDGLLIRSGQNAVLIDGGSSSEKKIGQYTIEPFLLASGVDTLDLAAVSHSDQDHMNGLLEILERRRIRVRRLALPASAEGNERYQRLAESALQTGTEIIYLKSGDKVFFGGDRRINGEKENAAERKELAELCCVHPESGAAFEDPNSESLCFLLRFGEFRMLFTGDLPKEEEEGMLRNLLDCGDEGYPDLDILKAGHHGSSTSTSEELLERLQPEYAILSYGENNRYGHPHQETLKLLEEHKITRLDTGGSGEIKINVSKSGDHYRISRPYKAIRSAGLNQSGEPDHEDLAVF